MADTISDTSKTSGIVPMLEKAYELKTSLLLFAFVMFLDSAMLLSNGSGLYDLYASPDTLRINLVLDFALIFVFFSLFASVVVPIVSLFVRAVAIQCFFSMFYDPRRATSMQQVGYVRLTEVSKQAHLTKEDYLLKLEKEEKEKEEKAQEQQFRLTFLCMSCCLLSAYNLLHDYTSSKSLLQHIEQVNPEYGFYILLFFVGIFLVAAMWLMVHDDTTYVYCPSLARDDA